MKWGPGRMTLALPLKPSVPPSMIGMMEDWTRDPSSCDKKIDRFLKQIIFFLIYETVL
jgi:hypothetical protein